jgi:hypothetical protein
MKRSVQPLPSGARTKAGELVAPRNRISFWKSPLMHRGAMVVADLQTCGDVAADRAEAVAHRLADRHEGLEAGGAVAGVDPDALGRAVIDRTKTAALVDLSGRDRAVMCVSVRGRGGIWRRAVGVAGVAIEGVGYGGVCRLQPRTDGDPR